jgi:hypothetical protein
MRCIHGPEEGNVQIVHGNSGKAAQKGFVRRRSKAEKVGRLKYIIELLKRLERQISEIDVRTRTLMAGLREWISFKPSYIQKVACEDEVDAEIITCLIQKGVGGLLPSAIASKLSKYGLKRWNVTRRIQRMNKKLMKELGQKIAEKRGHCWAPTSFMLDAWNVEKREEIIKM